MLPLGSPDRIHVAFDDHRLVANAGLLLPVTLAQHLGLGELVDRHVDLGDAPGRANPGDKLLTLVASALAGGDCIDDADVLRHRPDGQRHRLRGQSAIHPGDLSTQFPVGSCSPVGSGEPGVAGSGLGRRWGPGRCAVDHRPGLHHLRDLRTGQGRAPVAMATPASGAITRCWPSPRDTGDVLMVRLRQGRANTARGADHFLRETVGRVRYAGAIGQLTVRADSGFYTHAMVAVCRKMDVRYSITVRQHQSLRNLIEAIPEKDWTAIPYWMDGRCRRGRD